jgi:hypothetical protein
MKSEIKSKDARKQKMLLTQRTWMQYKVANATRTFNGFIFFTKKLARIDFRAYHHNPKQKVRLEASILKT